MRNICASITVLLATLACGCTQHDTTVLKNKLDDAEITTAVKTKLATDEGLRTVTGIHVTSSNGVVTLAGEVPGSYESSKAEHLAASVDGVAKVRNDLHVETASNQESSESRSRQKPRRNAR
jgi:osmotically-inducible protein OsmY